MPTSGISGKGIGLELKVGVSGGTEQMTGRPLAGEHAVFHLPVAGIRRSPATESFAIEEFDPAMRVRFFGNRSAGLGLGVELSNGSGEDESEGKCDWFHGVV